MFLEISQNSQENACARVSFLIKLQAWGKFLTNRLSVFDHFVGLALKELRESYDNNLMYMY